jgi:hypothetical protein
VLHHAARFETVPAEVIQYSVDKFVEEGSGWTASAPVVRVMTIETVQVLAAAYQEALMESENDGLLPHHVAAKKRTLEFVQKLFEMCPGAVQAMSSDGFLPLDGAAMADAPLDVMYFLARSWPRALGCDREQLDPPDPTNNKPAPTAHRCFGCMVL